MENKNLLCFSHLHSCVCSYLSLHMLCDRMQRQDQEPVILEMAATIARHELKQAIQEILQVLSPAATTPAPTLTATKLIPSCAGHKSHPQRYTMGIPKCFKVSLQLSSYFTQNLASNQEMIATPHSCLKGKALQWAAAVWEQKRGGDQHMFSHQAVR